MSTPANLPERDGIASLLDLAKKSCTLLNTFGFLIEQKYPNGTAVNAFYVAAKAVCALLPEAQAEWYEPGGQNEPITENPELTPGINPAAPAPPPLPE